MVAVKVEKFLGWDGEADCRGFVDDVHRLSAAMDDVVD